MLRCPRWLKEAWPQQVHHGRAHEWFGALGDEAWGTTAITEVGFLRLVNLAATSGAVLATFDRSIPTYLEPVDRRHVLVLP